LQQSTYNSRKIKEPLSRLLT